MKTLITLIALIAIITCFNSYAVTYEKVSDTTLRKTTTETVETTQIVEKSLYNLKMELEDLKSRKAEIVAEWDQSIKDKEDDITEAVKLNLIEIDNDGNVIE